MRGGSLLPLRSAIEGLDGKLESVPTKLLLWLAKNASSFWSEEDFSGRDASVDSRPEGDGCREDMSDKSDQFVDEGENVKELAESELEGESVGDFELNFGGLLLRKQGK